MIVDAVAVVGCIVCLIVGALKLSHVLLGKRDLPKTLTRDSIAHDSIRQVGQTDRQREKGYVDDGQTIGIQKLGLLLSASVGILSSPHAWSVPNNNNNNISSN